MKINAMNAIKGTLDKAEEQWKYDSKNTELTKSKKKPKNQVLLIICELKIIRSINQILN